MSLDPEYEYRKIVLKMTADQQTRLRNHIANGGSATLFLADGVEAEIVKLAAVSSMRPSATSPVKKRWQFWK